MVVPFLLVLPKMSVHSLARDESSHNSDDRLSGLALMHLHHDLNIDVNEICTNFFIKHKWRMFQGCILYE